MAYPTCPECRVPQPVADDATGFRCIDCFAQIRFGECAHCGVKQAIPSGWTAFTCVACLRRVDVRSNEPESGRTKAAGVTEVGQPFPKF